MIGFHHKVCDYDNNGKENYDGLGWQCFSKIDESTIFDFFHYVGFKKDNIGNLKQLVKDRNKVAHANGVISISNEENFVEKLK